jgi:non-heme chloroperoxidase
MRTRICPSPGTGKRMHDAIKESTLVVIKGGPHGLIWTHADEVNKALVKFSREEIRGDQDSNRIFSILIKI